MYTAKMGSIIKLEIENGMFSVQVGVALNSNSLHLGDNPNQSPK
jgi:hypothetical protein